MKRYGSGQYRTEVHPPILWKHVTASASTSARHSEHRAVLLSVLLFLYCCSLHLCPCFVHGLLQVVDQVIAVLDAH